MRPVTCSSPIVETDHTLPPQRRAPSTKFAAPRSETRPPRFLTHDSLRVDGGPPKHPPPGKRRQLFENLQEISKETSARLGFSFKQNNPCQLNMAPNVPGASRDRFHSNQLCARILRSCRIGG